MVLEDSKPAGGGVKKMTFQCYLLFLFSFFFTFLLPPLSQAEARRGNDPRGRYRNQIFIVALPSLKFLKKSILESTCMNRFSGTVPFRERRINASSVSRR